MTCGAGLGKTEERKTEDGKGTYSSPSSLLLSSLFILYFGLVPTYPYLSITHEEVFC